MNNVNYAKQLNKFADNFLNSLHRLNENEVAKELISVFAKNRDLYQAVSEKLIDTSKTFRENNHESKNKEQI